MQKLARAFLLTCVCVERNFEPQNFRSAICVFYSDILVFKNLNDLFHYYPENMNLISLILGKYGSVWKPCLGKLGK